MSKPRIYGMTKACIPNSKADMRFKKNLYQHGREIAEREPVENRAGRREQRRLDRKKMEAVHECKART